MLQIMIIQAVIIKMFYTLLFYTETKTNKKKPGHAGKKFNLAQLLPQHDIIRQGAMLACQMHTNVSLLSITSLCAVFWNLIQSHRSVAKNWTSLIVFHGSPIA